MKKIFLLILLAMPFLMIAALAQDNLYGDYLLTSFNKKVSLDLEDAKLVDVLKMLSQQTNLNFISTEAIKDRKLTLYMDQVPLKEAMDIIFKANNLAYDYFPDSSIFIVKEMGKPTMELVTKVYQLKYVRVLSTRLQKEIENTIEAQNQGGGTGSSRTDTKKTGIKQAVEGVLTAAGKVTEDPITNSLVVVDVPAQFPVIDEVIAKLDVPIPRVMIEVEMLDVSKSHLDQMGFYYANGLYGAVAGAARSTSFPFTSQIWRTNPTGQNPRTSGAGIAAPVLGIIDLTNFTAVMQFLAEDTSTKFLARPKIMTVSNETAEINLTVNEAIGLTTTTSEGGNITQNIEREETGTKLRVTPQVNPNTQEITLFVEVFNRESVNSGLKTSSLTAGEIKNVEERGTKNMMRLKNGETLYIGGLIRKKEKEIITKIPLLADIPIVGRLFRFKDKPGEDNVDRELLVFLTPRLMEDRPGFNNGPKILSREQYDASRKDAITVALDTFKK